MRFDKIPTWPEWQNASSSWFQSRSSKPALVRIDNLIKRYHMVLDMSRLNVLHELHHAISDWAADKIDRGSSSQRWPAMRALEAVVLAKLHELDNFGKHKYASAVCIGFEIKTGDYSAQPPRNSAERFIKEKDDINSRTDQLRLAIMQAAANESFQSKALSAAERRKRLKIFMAPEFFFRGPYGAYADIGMIHSIFDKMRATTKGERFENWIFVLGTALFTSDKEHQGKKQGNLLENYALVQRGGPGGGQELDQFVIAKEFPSHIDFKLGQGLSPIDWYDPKKSKAIIAGKEVKAITPEGGRKDPIYQSLHLTGDPRLSELTGGSVFTMHGIRFGLEVCRDHHVGKLAHSQEAGTISIQLIPSAGMSITNTNIACRYNGLVFNVDGITPHTAIKVTGNAPQPALAVQAPAAGGKVKIYDPVPIAYSPAARLDVAARLKIPRAVMSGDAPPLPPRD